MTSRDPHAPLDEEVAPFSADFSERVLRAAEATRRRRRLGGSAVVLVALAVVGTRRWTAPMVEVPAAARPTPTASLSSEDFAWLEEVGTSTSTPSAVVFPEDLGDDLLGAGAESI